MIREMTIYDYNGAVRLWRSIEGMGLHEVDDSRRGIEGFLYHNPGLCFVAVEDGTLTGTILCGSDGRRGHLYHLAVRPEHRGRGTGRALVDRALKELAARGIQKAVLVSFQDNASGNRFWASAGFQRRDDLYYHSMELEVPPAQVL